MIDRQQTSDAETHFHPYAWLIWLAAAVALPLQSRNPLYLTIVLLSVALVYQGLSYHTPAARSWSAFVKLGVIVALVAIPFNALTAHYGDIVLFTLPHHWPIIGGIITLEAVLFGASGGLALITLLLIFATFHNAVGPTRLIRLTPSVLLEAGVIVTIAVTFVPQMFLTFKEVREAQQVRGHRIRGLRSFLPLIIPLFTMSLERSIQLAESMEARGFGHTSRRPTLPKWVKLLSAMGLLGVGAGLITAQYASTWRPIALVLAVIAAIALVSTGYWYSRSRQRSSYRRWLWRRRDTAVALASLVPVVAIIGLRTMDRWALVYYPYPPQSPWPPFEPLLGLALTALIVPLVFSSQRKHGAARNPVHTRSLRLPVDGRAPADTKILGEEDQVAAP